MKDRPIYLCIPDNHESDEVVVGAGLTLTDAFEDFQSKDQDGFVPERMKFYEAKPLKVEWQIVERTTIQPARGNKASS